MSYVLCFDNLKHVRVITVVAVEDLETDECTLLEPHLPSLTMSWLWVAIYHSVILQVVIKNSVVLWFTPLYSSNQESDI